MSEQKMLPRMRTVNRAYQELKNLDNCSCISKWCIYQLANENQVRNFKSGTRLYIDLDDLIRFFNLDCQLKTS